MMMFMSMVMAVVMIVRMRVSVVRMVVMIVRIVLVVHVLDARRHRYRGRWLRVEFPAK